MSNPIVTRITGGYWKDGACHREVHLRELTGEDHAFLMEDCRGLLPAHWVTEALARCVTRLGADEPVARETIRALTVGDREALLLHLRRMTFGDRMRCVVTCDSPGCNERLEFELKIRDLLVPACGNDVQQHHECTIRHEGVPYDVRFRLPSGADQEVAAAIAATDVEAATDLLLQRCVESVVSAERDSVDTFPEAVRNELPVRMAELDPQAETTLHLSCPVCGTAFSVIFDAASHLIQELRVGIRHLYREVHRLAYHYHWSATEILGMSTAKRKRFLRLLEEELMEAAAT